MFTSYKPHQTRGDLGPVTSHLCNRFRPKSDFLGLVFNFFQNRKGCCEVFPGRKPCVVVRGSNERCCVWAVLNASERVCVSE